MATLEEQLQFFWQLKIDTPRKRAQLESPPSLHFRAGPPTQS
jgi:hypothetical protein